MKCEESMQIQHVYVFKILIAMIEVYVLGVVSASQTLYMDNYKVVIQDHRCINTVASFSTVSKTYCATKCCRYSTCYGFNYEKSSGTCELVQGLSALNNLTTHTGFSVYNTTRLDDYIDVGGYVIAVHTNQLNNNDAVAACAPYGRLLRIETNAKFNTITAYLESRRHNETSLEHVWIDGYFNGTNTYKFLDGSLPPVLEDPSILRADSESQNCLRIGYLSGYLLRDMYCDRVYAFICEPLH